MMNSLIIKRGLKTVDTFKNLSIKLAANAEIVPKKKKEKKNVAKILSSEKLVPNVAKISSSVKLVSNETNFKIVVDEPITFAKQSEKSPILSKILEEEKKNETHAEAFLGYAIEKSDQNEQID